MSIFQNEAIYIITIFLGAVFCIESDDSSDIKVTVLSKEVSWGLLLICVFNGFKLGCGVFLNVSGVQVSQSFSNFFKIFFLFLKYV